MLRGAEPAEAGEQRTGNSNSDDIGGMSRSAVVPDCLQSVISDGGGSAGAGVGPEDDDMRSPNSISRCLAFAGVEFERLYTHIPAEVNAFLADPDGYLAAIQQVPAATARTKLEVVVGELVTGRCTTFMECLVWSRMVFQVKWLLMITLPRLPHGTWVAWRLTRKWPSFGQGSSSQRRTVLDSV